MDHNTPEAVSFLKAWPARPLVLTFIPIDKAGKKGKLLTKVFTDPVDGAEMAAWIEEHQGKGNLYFSVNAPLDATGDKKAKRTDIKEIVAWHVDLDPRVGEPQADAAMRLEKKLSHYNPKPSFILGSGGGVQAFWLLDQAIPVNGDLAIAEDLKLYNVHFERELGGDNCHNIDRIMRVPGTINVPDDKKLAKGRVPALAKMIWQSSQRYPLAAFIKATRVQEADADQGSVRVTIGSNRASIEFDDERLKALEPWVRALGAQGDYNGKYGGDRSKAVFAFVCECVRARIADDVIADIIADKDWAISEHILAQKDVTRAIERNITRAKEHAEDPELERLNSQYSVTRHGSKVRVQMSGPSLIHPNIQEYSYLTYDDFKNLLSNRKKTINVMDGNGNLVPKVIPLTEWWLGQKNRKQFDNGVAFMPHIDADVVQGRMNTWTGFSVAPKQGDGHKRWKAHVGENVCDGNQEHFDYAMNWMANAVQNRGGPGQVAFCVRGDEGIGKGVFIRGFGFLFGRHFLHVVNQEHLVGKFNPHLENALVVFADECVSAGDRRGEQILKGLITEPTLFIEPKGLGAYEAPNYLHILMGTNNEWAVPAGPTARRYFMLTCNPRQRQNFELFTGIEREMKEGGHASLLWELMTRDIKNFNVRAVPTTEALREQKALSRRGMDAVIEVFCREGRLPGAKLGMPHIMLTNHDQHDVWGAIRTMAPEITRMTVAGIQNALRKDWGCKGWHSNHECGYEFPALPVLRSRFEARHGKQDWNTMTAWQQPGAGRGEGIPF